MAALIGYVKGSRGEAHRLGHSTITARLSTWTGNAVLRLEKDGTAVFTVNGREAWIGNINKKSEA